MYVLRCPAFALAVRRVLTPLPPPLSHGAPLEHGRHHHGRHSREDDAEREEDGDEDAEEAAEVEEDVSIVVAGGGGSAKTGVTNKIVSTPCLSRLAKRKP